MDYSQDQDKPVRSVSDSELEILKTLWQFGRLKVGDVRERLNRDGRQRAYNTVQTLLNRLEAKGYVGSSKQGRAFVFYANVSQTQYLSGHLKNLADRVCQGSEAPLMLALVEGNRFSREEIRRFRSLLDRLEEAGD